MKPENLTVAIEMVKRYKMITDHLKEIDGENKNQLLSLKQTNGIRFNVFLKIPIKLAKELLEQEKQEIEANLLVWGVDIQYE